MKVRIPNQGGGNPQNLMKQIDKYQECLKLKQEELDKTEFEVSSGGGMVKVKILGSKEILSIKIDPSVVSTEEEEIEMLEDMIIAAVNEAIKTVDNTTNEEMDKITSSFNLPKIPGLI